MKLRPRLAGVTIAATVPMVAALVLLDGFTRHRAAENELALLALSSVTRPGERERCEAAPATWGAGGPRRDVPPDVPRPPPPGPPPGPPPPGSAAGGAPPPRPGRGGDHPPPHRAPARLFAYDAELRSANPSAPDVSAFAGELDDQDWLGLPWELTDPTASVLLRTPWTSGPCAVVVARGTTEPWLGALLPPTRIWLAPVVMVFGTLLAAMGPVVRRLRRLADEVRQAAAAGYSASVELGGDDEISELARAFDEAAREVRTQLAEKDRRERALREFLANTTHDVMIPLTVLQGHLASIRDRAAAGAAPDAAAISSAMDEAHYLGSLVHDLAAAARLEAGDDRTARAPVELGALVARVVSRHAPIARQRSIELVSAAPEHAVTVQGDVTLLEQAVSNVVFNAIRYNRAGGHVAVILETRATELFRLRVVDDGPGLAPLELERIRERGYRGDAARARAPEGSGLGLDIVSRVAELHGLTLALARSEHGGLQVDLEGPAGHGPAPAGGAR